VKTGGVVLLAIMVSVGAGAWAQSPSPEEATVRALDDQERIAALKRDTIALERLWSDQITVNAPNNKVVVGKRALLDAFVRTGIINFSTFERQIEFIRVDGDFALIMGLEALRPLSDAPSAGLVAGQLTHRRFTNIWRKEAGTWRLYARHANVIASR
jgi:ketosteroid isomerase-like protein